jgi:hypothetical protein
VKLIKSLVYFLSIEVEHALLKTIGHNTCNTQKKLELERNSGALTALPSMVTFFSSFLFPYLSNQPRLAVKL